MKIFSCVAVALYLAATCSAELPGFYSTVNRITWLVADLDHAKQGWIGLGMIGTAMVKRLLATGIDPNGYPAADSGFHSHGTPLHQAVSSGSLDTVKLLVEAGAKLNAPDNIYDGTPLDWADYMQRDEHDEAAKRNFASIEDYLREAEGTDHAPIGS